MIRRKSDAARQKAEPCPSAKLLAHEQRNQELHEQRQQDPDHEQFSSCWCCCADCHDLTFHPVKE